MKTNKFVMMLNEKRELYLTTNGYANVRGVSTLDKPKLISEYVCGTYNADLQPVEKVWLICMDNKYKVTGSFEVSSGTIENALISPREVFRMALMANASNVAICHNHTSGDPTPSKQDMDVTKSLIKAGGILNLPLTDHIVVGANGQYFSFREKCPEQFSKTK